MSSGQQISNCAFYFTFRIIEIAGGREVFCQSRSKPGRKSRHVRETRDRDEANTSKTNKTETSERRVWELRSRYVNQNSTPFKVCSQE